MVSSNVLPVLPKEVPALVNATDKSFVPTAKRLATSFQNNYNLFKMDFIIRYNHLRPYLHINKYVRALRLFAYLLYSMVCEDCFI